MTPDPRSPERRSDPKGLLLLLCVLALCARALVAWRTLAPDRDTANYVEMAQNFRAGEWALALAEVFPPLHPFLLSLVGSLAGPGNEDWWLTGQVLCTLLGVLSVWLLWKAAALFVTDEGSAWVPAIAATWLALGMLPAWNAADALSEGLFMVLLCTWMLAWARERVWWLSVLAGLCFLTRPEGAILFGPVLWLLLRPGDAQQASLVRRCGRATVVVAAGGSLPLFYLLARAEVTGDFQLLPVGRFMQPLSVFSDPELLPRILAYLQRLARFLEQGFDGVGYLAFPALFVALWGLCSLSRPQRERILPLVLTACVACLVVPLFKSNRRFWITWLPILLPVAARPVSSLAQLAPRLRMRPWVLVALVVVLMLVPHVVRLPRARRAELLIDKQLAQYLVAQGAERGQIASDLPRFLFFAEQPPLPPRHWSAADFHLEARAPQTKYVVGVDRQRVNKLGSHPPSEYNPVLSVSGKLDGRKLERLGYRRMRPAGAPLGSTQFRSLILYSR